MRLDHGLDRVGDEFTRGEGEFHPAVSHGDAIIHADGVEFEGYSARLAHRVLNLLTKFLQVDVSRYYIHIRIDDGDEGLVKIPFADNAGRPQERAVGSFVITFFDDV